MQLVSVVSCERISHIYVGLVLDIDNRRWIRLMSGNKKLHFTAAARYMLTTKKVYSTPRHIYVTEYFRDKMPIPDSLPFRVNGSIFANVHRVFLSKKQKEKAIIFQSTYRTRLIKCVIMMYLLVNGIPSHIVRAPTRVREKNYSHDVTN